MKSSKPGAVSTSIHETHHVFALACGAVKIGIPEAIYTKSAVHTHVDGDTGEAAVDFGDGVPREVQMKIASLGAMGPVASVPMSNLPALLKSRNTQALIDAGELSEKDLDLIAEWDGSPTTPPLVVLATRELQDMLGSTKFQSFAKLVRDISNSNVEAEFRLADLVPYEAAEAALARAEKRLQELM